MKINLQKNFAFRKIMKITLSQIVIALLFTGISFAEKSNAQAVLNQIVSISVHDARLSSALKQIEKDANVKFVYSKNVVKIDQNVSIQATDQKLSMVLDMLLNSNGIAYEAFDNRIVLSNKRDEIFSNISEESGKNNEEKAQFVVTGKVTDRDGQPLIGVSVKVKGTGIGASTDGNGQYSLTLPEGNGTLVFTYIGYVTQEISVNNQTTINVSLQEDAKSLDEVVVIAYGVQKKATVTGAISSIQTKEIKQSPAANLAVTLAGRLPGLTAIQTSGEPGKDVTLLYLRGRGTINGQNPIILVDGVPRDITYIDPNEVENIAILKDASATAMFGVRGANGVILVTTKRGKSGKPEINFTEEGGLQSFTTFPSQVSSYDHARLRNQAGVNDNLGPNFFYSEAALQHFKLQDDPIHYPDNDWSKILMHKYVPQMRYVMNLTGGDNYVKYFVNAGYLNQGGLWKVDQKDYDPSSYLKRYNFRSNVDAYLNKNKSLKAFLNVAGYLEKVNSSYVIGQGIPPEVKTLYLLASVYGTPRVQPGPLTPSGEVLSSGSVFSAYGALNRSGYVQETGSNITSSFGMDQDLKFITPGLSAKVMMSFDTRTRYDLTAKQTHEEWYQVIVPNLKGVDGRDSVRYVRYSNDLNTNLVTSTSSSFQSYANLQLFANYDRTFGKHIVTGLLLAQQDQIIKPDDRLPFNLRGLSSRITYGYDNRYFFEFNAGYNGSEQFAKHHRYGFFPAISAGWLISNEQFLKNSPVISLLKLRASSGKVGNDQLGSRRFLYLDNISVQDGGYSANLGRGTMINEISRGNPNLLWEIANKTNFGLDLGFFDQLNISLDIFNEQRDNILIDRQTVPQINGFPGQLPPVNLGRMKNHGYEIELNYSKSINKDLGAMVKLNFNNAKNEVEFRDEPKRSADFAYPYRQTGYSLGQQFGYEANGFWSSQDEINKSGLTFVGIQPRPGDLMFVDKNGDKIINDKDIAPIGYNSLPQYTYGAAFSVNYKSFDISVLLQGVAKVSNYFTGYGVYENGNDLNLPNYRKRMLNAWTPERAAAGLPIEYPALSSSLSSSSISVQNSFFNENTSYLRLKNAEIGYTLPIRWSKKIGSNKIRLYTNGLNIYTWKKMHNVDYDPELSRFGTLTYPILRVFNFGVNVVF